MSISEQWPILRPWKMYLAVGLPLLLSPLLIFGDSQEYQASFVLILMAVYWFTEAIPIPITGILPIFLYPIMGIQDTAVVAAQYFKNSIMIFISGLLGAIAFEFCNLHLRIALRVMLFVGASIRMLMLGIMLTTMFLSMWMFNTAATAMMIPIIAALTGELEKGLMNNYETMKKSDSNSNGENGIELTSSVKSKSTAMPSEIEAIQKTIKDIKTMLLLATAYSSNIGGTGVITGTGSNLVALEFLGNLDSKHHGNYASLTYVNWMVFNLLPMCITVLMAWIYLQLVFLGLPNQIKFWQTSEQRSISSSLFTPAVGAKITKSLQEKYKKLGSITCHESLVLILFSIAVISWSFHEPKLIPGWSSWFSGTKVSISTSGLLVGVLFFVVPRNPEFYRAIWTRGIKMEPLLDYKFAEKRIPWGVILLIGGGYALSSGSTKAGLSFRIGQSLASLRALPAPLIQLICMCLIAFLTEIASNVATASVVVPILTELAKELNVHPFYFALPASVTCSYAFMLPVATPPNAIVFAASDMKISTMIKNGFFMNIACILVLYCTTHFCGELLFHFSEYSYIP